MTVPYNPLDIENLGLNVLSAISGSVPTPLADVTTFTGAGIYVLYYTGDHAAYALLGERNRDEMVHPIYVGKAIPAGARKGVEVATSTATKQLSVRIREHARSVSDVADLDLADFHVRWLVIEPIWIPLGESLMIARTVPLWNALVDGFGNHDPGQGRAKGVRSRWDTLHPGRPWASKYPTRTETQEDIANDAREFLRVRFQV